MSVFISVIPFVFVLTRTIVELISSSFIYYLSKHLPLDCDLANSSLAFETIPAISATRSCFSSVVGLTGLVNLCAKSLILCSLVSKIPLSSLTSGGPSNCFCRITANASTAVTLCPNVPFCILCFKPDVYLWLPVNEFSTTTTSSIIKNEIIKAEIKQMKKQPNKKQVPQEWKWWVISRIFFL